MATDIIARGMAANAKKSVTELGNQIESEKWIGTKAEWEAVDKSTIKDGTIVYITDDKTVILYDKAEMEKIAAQVAADRKAAETATQTAQAVADSLPEDYTTAVGKIAENTADISAIKLTDKELQRRVNALYDMGNGVTHKFETDTDTAYAKTIPTGAKLMSVKSIGGHSEVIDGEIVSAETESVVVGDATYHIPEAIRNLPGYGWSAGTARNYVDYENKKYYKCVDSMDLGTVNWQVETSPTFGTYFSTFVDSRKFKKIGDFTQKRHNILCDKYLTVKRDVKEYVDKTILLDGTVSVVTQIQVKDTAYTDATAFKQAMSGVMLCYELANPIVTDISALIDDDFLRNIDVEAGGSITFKNGNGDSYRIPVPSEEEYVVKLSEIGGTT